MKKIKCEFVDSIPEKILPGILYVSIRFSTAIHLCACGCGHEVVTPISPRGWKILYDGETISLSPSIGNWNFRCKSHYWIRKNCIEWYFEDQEIKSRESAISRLSYWERFCLYIGINR